MTAAAPVLAKQTGPGEITVTWKAVPGATGYNVGRSVWPDGYRRFRPNHPAQTSLVDRDIIAGVAHGYRVVALLPSGKASAPAVSDPLTPTRDAPGPQTPRTPGSPGGPGTPQTAPSPGPSPSSPGSGTLTPGGASAPGGGRIAYVRGSKEIRLIAPDGTNDRRILQFAKASGTNGINELAWRPDGKELAFSSGHDELYSIYDADIYAIKPYGTGLRKLTNAPDRSELGRYPKGSVSVTIRNTQPFYQRSQASTGLFIIYFTGADQPQQVLVLPGTSKTVVFKSVADFGKQLQPIVAIYGGYRWVAPGTDVQAGRAVKAPDFLITGHGVPGNGAYRPIWRNDGSRLSYRDGLCLVRTVPANPTPGEFVFQPLFPGKEPSGACAWDWGPTPTLAGQIIYTSNGENDGSNVMRIKEGGTHPGAKLHSFFSEADGQTLNDLRWLADGSGFLYSFPDHAYENGNLFRYDIATKRLTKLTNFEGEYTRNFDISPDGTWVVFERVKKLEDESGDLWVMRTDGTGLRLLVRNGLNPAW